MKIIRKNIKLKEAKDISKLKSVSREKRKEIINNILLRDDPIIAYHGTSFYWSMFLCFYGIKGNSPAPSKNLGQGNSSSGYKRIETSGLYVSPETSPFLSHYLEIEVKPSELSIPNEMENRDCDSGLESLILGEAIITKELPARRIIFVHTENKTYSRKDFLNLEEDPKEFISINADNNFYQSGDLSLLGMIEKNNLFKFLKSKIKRGSNIESLIDGIDSMIEIGEYKQRGITYEDMLEIRNWLEKIK